MHAAVLHAYGTPQFETFDDPVQQSDTEIVTVSAAAISNFDLFFPQVSIFSDQLSSRPSPGMMVLVVWRTAGGRTSPLPSPPTARWHNRPSCLRMS